RGFSKSPAAFAGDSGNQRLLGPRAHNVAAARRRSILSSVSASAATRRTTSTRSGSPTRSARSAPSPSILRQEPDPAAGRERDRRRGCAPLPADDGRESEGGEARAAGRVHLPEDARGGRHTQLLLDVHARPLSRTEPPPGSDAR